MNHLDLFSGVGGFSLGLKRAGIEVGWHGFSDIDKHANKVFKRRFPNAEELGSITDINPRKLPRIDLITFGFPCQDLSLANRKRGGLQANRSGLFFEAMRIIRVKKPKYFIFENVKGLFSSNEGKDFDIILRSIAECGYDGQWQLCNTRFFLPQNRERIYFVGHVRGECRPKVFPIGEGSSKNKKAQKINNNPQYARTITTAHAHGTAKHMSYIKEKTGLQQIGTIGKDSEATRVYDPNGIARTIKNGGGMGAKTGLYRVEDVNLIAKKRKHDTPKEINAYLKKHKNRTIKAIEKENKIRRLTPVECERLQGFPDGWTDGQSDTQRYKQCGNAVTVNVVEAIYRRLYAK